MKLQLSEQTGCQKHLNKLPTNSWKGHLLLQRLKYDLRVCERAEQEDNNTPPQEHLQEQREKSSGNDEPLQPGLSSKMRLVEVTASLLPLPVPDKAYRAAARLCLQPSPGPLEPQHQPPCFNPE